MDAKFHSSSTFDQMIRLTPRMREDIGTPKGSYYICLFAHTFASFSVMVKETSLVQKSDGNHGALFNELDNGFVYSDEIVSKKDKLEMNVYVYPVPALQFSDEDIFLEFRLTA